MYSTGIGVNASQAKVNINNYQYMQLIVTVR